MMGPALKTVALVIEADSLMSRGAEMALSLLEDLDPRRLAVLRFDTPWSPNAGVSIAVYERLSRMPNLVLGWVSADTVGAAADLADRCDVLLAEPGVSFGQTGAATRIVDGDPRFQRVGQRAEIEEEILAWELRARSRPARILAGLMRRSEGRSIESALFNESLAFSALQHGLDFAEWLNRPKN
jgi:hypothetical protein